MSAAVRCDSVCLCEKSASVQFRVQSGEAQNEIIIMFVFDVELHDLFVNH